jgi:hypothetical protein
MLVNHERRLLNRAAEARDARISIRKKPDDSWPSDHSRLTALESVGHLERIGQAEATSPEFATWQITTAGLSQLRTLNLGGR